MTFPLINLAIGGFSAGVCIMLIGSYEYRLASVNAASSLVNFAMFAAFFPWHAS